jgi:hypothetical protein
VLTGWIPGFHSEFRGQKFRGQTAAASSSGAGEKGCFLDPFESVASRRVDFCVGFLRQPELILYEKWKGTPYYFVPVDENEMTQSPFPKVPVPSDD